VVAVDVEIIDPWDGPRTFAEDYYSGGDRLAPALTPNHLTPLDGSPVPAFVPNFPTGPNIIPDKNQLPPSAGVLSTSHSPKPYNIVAAFSFHLIFNRQLKTVAFKSTLTSIFSPWEKLGTPTDDTYSNK
jgi:hypothetical protein